MTDKVAQKLDSLLAASEPVVHTPAGKIFGPVSKDLWDKIFAAEQSATDEMIRQEIVAAAKEKRKTDICCPDWGMVYWAGNKSDGWANIPWPATARRWELATPIINSLIKVHNDATRLAYETYRIACEQGVAIPPVK